MLNQGFDCFIPKVKVIKNNKKREINLFPGYGFAYLSSSKITLLKYTKGIKTVLQQGKGYASISSTDISNIMLHSENTLTNPIIYKPKIGDTIKIDKGAFKNNLAQVIGLKGKERIELMLNFLSRETIIDFDLKNITQI
jgi:transcriptional antiterminator RfaH